uniref:Uncharacterized protein n=1 Tax=Oxyrrhis marina TaxID=2969 RepID=A0A7S3XIE0_OXYMA
MIPTAPAKEYFCSGFKLTSTDEGLHLQAPLFGVTISQPKNVLFSGPLTEVVHYHHNYARTHYLVVNLSLEGVSNEQVEVMVWFDMKNWEEREALKKLIERHIGINEIEQIPAGSMLL